MKLINILNEHINDKVEYILDKMKDNYEAYDLYPGYSEPLDDDEDFVYNTKEIAEKDAEMIIDMFDSLPNPIPVYRSLMVKSEDDIDFDYIGESWSFRKDSAISFGSHNGSNFLISGLIDKDYVNWDETINRFILFSSGGDDDDENEIVIKDMDKIKIIGVKELKWK
jgi:hypothetical protein